MHTAASSPIALENDHFSVKINQRTGALSSLVVKRTGHDLIGEARLQKNFRICLPLPEYEGNYIEGMEQQVRVDQEDSSVTISSSGLSSPQGHFPIELQCRITLQEEAIRFAARLTNNSPHAISEFWFPRLGGLTQFGKTREAKGAIPGYVICRHDLEFFRRFPGTQPLGAETAEWRFDYPGQTMPWMDLYDPDSDTGLYLGYHDPILRLSTWHMALHPRTSGATDAWIAPEDAGGEPVGLVFSHVRYPFIRDGETFESGEFFLRVHPGDWHEGSKFYGGWFREHFPIKKTKSWLRKKSAWFTSIIYQPEDRVVTDYVGYDQWCRDAEQCGINTHELIGWDKGGLERDYPEYIAEPKLGGEEGLRQLLRSIDDRGSKCLLFVNYNVLDQNTDLFKAELHKYVRQDNFGITPNWMCWGQSTLMARQGYARRHLAASIVPPLQKMLEDYFLDLVRLGAHGFQIDKICINSLLDFNPLNTAKPDVALCENLVQAIAALLEKCREINPDFCIASEADHDRLIPYVDVFYRNVIGSDISPLRYVFPEWTSCQHISAPSDYKGVNAAVLTGAVLCVEPFMYQGSLGHPLYRKLGKYIQEIERIRHELADLIFLGNYHDTVGASVRAMGGETPLPESAGPRVGAEVIIPGGLAPTSTAVGELQFRVHSHEQTGRRAIVVANERDTAIRYRWEFQSGNIQEALLYQPFQPVRTVFQGEPLEIEGSSLQILVEPETMEPCP